MAEVKNIIVGGAKVFIGAASSDDTAFIGDAATYTVGGADSVTNAQSVAGVAGKGVQKNYTEIGFTTDGIDLSIEPEYSDVEVDQLLDSAILFKTSQKVSFGTTLAEGTLVNLARAIGQADSTVTDASGYDAAGETKVLGIRGGSLGEFPSERGIVAVANGPRHATLRSERVFEVFRAISVESVGVSVKRNEVTAFPVTFRCLPAGSTYMKIADRLYT
jgi:hypothetical protein